MVAVDLSRLKGQLEGLTEAYAQPDLFRDRLRMLFSFYQARAYRDASGRQSLTILRRYNLPPVLVLQLEQALRPVALSCAEETLRLAESLWADEYFEVCELGAYLLGCLAPADAPRLLENLRSFLWSSPDDTIAEVLLRKGSYSLQRLAPGEWNSFVVSLLEDPRPKKQNYGLMALEISAEHLSFDSLPAYLRALRPLIQSAGVLDESRLTNCVDLMIRQSPQEVLYLLKELLADTPGKKIEHQLRRYLALFGPEDAEDLQRALADHRSHSSLGH